MTTPCGRAADARVARAHRWFLPRSRRPRKRRRGASGRLMDLARIGVGVRRARALTGRRRTGRTLRGFFRVEDTDPGGPGRRGGEPARRVASPPVPRRLTRKTSNGASPVARAAQRRARAFRRRARPVTRLWMFFVKGDAPPVASRRVGRHHRARHLSSTLGASASSIARASTHRRRRGRRRTRGARGLGRREERLDEL